MKIVACADTHGSRGAEDTIRKLLHAERPDIFVCAGDWTTFGQSGERMLAIFTEAADQGARVLFVPGNHESSFYVEDLDVLPLRCVNLHLRIVEFQGVLFYGVGAYHDGLKPLAVELDELARLLDKTPARARVMVSHEPPFGFRPDPRTPDIGPLSLRDFITRTEPDWVVCGHVHIGLMPVVQGVAGARVINPGAHGAVIEIPEGGGRR